MKCNKCSFFTPKLGPVPQSDSRTDSSNWCIGYELLKLSLVKHWWLFFLDHPVYNFLSFSRCHSCKSSFNTYEEKQHHLETQHTRECPVCHKSYSRTYLKEHMLFHLESSRLTCNICSKVRLKSFSS